MTQRPLNYDPDEFRDHDRFVTALAARLMRDPDAARDAAQDAWAIALMRERPDHVTLRAWLAGILRNLVRSRQRDAARHARLAARIPSLDAGGRVDELVARTEIEQRMLEAVLELDAPIRAAVMLRFRDGLSSAEISRELHIPSGTARWRIHRGLEQVRERLDRQHGGDRDAWRSPLLLLAKSSVSSTLPWIGGILAMKLKVAVPLAVAVLLGTFLVLRGPADANRAVSRSSPRDVIAPPPATSIASRDVEGVSSARRSAEVVPTPPTVEVETLEVRGRCIDPEGRALGEVDIAFVDAAQAVDGWPGNAHAAGRDVTAEDGTFRTRVPLAEQEIAAPRRVGGRSNVPEQVLRFSRDDLIARVISTFQVSGASADLGDIVLRPGGWLTGRVVDERGRPIPDAKVGTIRRLHLNPVWRDGIGPAPEEARTDRDGRFRIAGIEPGWVRTRAVGDGYFSGWSDPTGVQPGRHAGDVVIVLPEIGDRVIAGRALDHDGAPLVGASITHRYEVGSNGVHVGLQTDAEGRFSVRAFDAVPHSFLLRHNGSLVEVTDVMPGRRDVVLRVPPLQSSRSVVRVLDAETNAALSPCSVYVHDEGAGASVRFSEQEGDRFVVPVPTSSFRVSAFAPGYRRAELGPFEPGAQPPEITIRLSPSPAFRGVVLRDGEPVTGARVSLTSASNIMSLWGFPVRSLGGRRDCEEGTTGQDGEFELRPQADDIGSSRRFYVRAELPGMAAAEAGPFEYGREAPDRLVLNLDFGGAIEGSVRVAEGRSPAGVLVAASRGDGFPVATRTNAEGGYVFRNLTPGPWQVELRDVDFDPSAFGSAHGMHHDTPIPANCVVPLGGVVRVDLSLREEERCTLAGRVLAEQPLPGFIVSLYACEDPSAWRSDPGLDRGLDDLRGPRCATTAVLPDKSYSLSVTNAGTYLAVLSNELLSRYRSEVEAIVDLVPGEVAFDFDVQYRRVTGRVVGPSSFPEWGHERTRVDWAVPIGPRARASGFGFAERDGKFTLESVPAGVVVAKVLSYWDAGGDAMEIVLD